MVLSVDIVLSGGGMGHDPRDPASWSGSALNLIKAFEKKGVLNATGGPQLSSLMMLIEALPHFSLNREKWRRRVFRTPSYRTQLGQKIQQSDLPMSKARAVIQLGAYCNVTSILPSPIYTYQDGCAFSYAESPFADREFKYDPEDPIYQFERAVAIGAKRVLSTSEWLARRMTQTYELPPGHAVNVGIGVQFDDIKLRGPKSYDTQDIIFIGKEFDRKGGLLLLEAFEAVRARHPKARLHIIGPPPHAMRAGAGIHQHGFLDRSCTKDLAKLTEIMQKASLLVLPSLYEPLGLAPLETMALGIPAAVTGEWALKENVQDGVDGAHLKLGDGAHIARVISDLLAEPQTLQRLGQAAAKSPALMSWDDVADSMIRLMIEDGLG